MLQTTHENGFTILKEDYEEIAMYVNRIASICHGAARAAGWWNKPADNGTRFMLMVSEIALLAATTPYSSVGAKLTVPPTMPSDTLASKRLPTAPPTHNRPSS